MTTERQHYVPRGYLRGFAAEDAESDSYVWAYEKLPDRRPRKVSVKAVCWESYYYEQEREDGSRDMDSLEMTISQNIENTVLPIINNLNPVVGSPINLTEEERGKLAFFLGFSMTRVPSFRDPIRRYYTNIAQSALENFSARDQKEKDFVDKYGIFAEAKPWVSLKPMAKAAEIIAYSAIGKNWQFFVPPKDVSLVTSDNPIIFDISLGNTGTLVTPDHPLAELVMNLRKDLALVCTPKRAYKQGMVFNMPAHEARKFNRGVVRAARRFVFCDHYSTNMDAFVKKYIGQEQTLILD